MPVALPAIAAASTTAASATAATSAATIGAGLTAASAAAPIAAGATTIGLSTAGEAAVAGGLTGITTATPVAAGASSFLTGANLAAASTLASGAAAVLGPKPPKPVPPPRAPDVAGLFARNGASKAAGTLAGTFLTGGSAQVAPKTTGGKTLLGS